MKEGELKKHSDHQALWHNNSCFNKCSSAKLIRSELRRGSILRSLRDSDKETSTQPSLIKTRHASLGKAAKSSTRDDRK